MAYRPMDPTMDTTGPPEKTIRSHEQNQERAFIAASRRGDRGIEARLQSARRASEVHKLRTGKGLCVSKEIVLKEEMYEEMDDGFPRSYQLRGPHQRRSSANIGTQGGRDPKSPAAVAELDPGQEQQLHENEVNREFAQYFPQVDQILSRRWSTQSIFTASPNGFQNPLKDNYADDVRPGSHSRSLTDSSTPEIRKEADVTPPTLATEFGSYPSTPQSQAASGFKQAMLTESFRGCNPNYDESAYAANLPPEANMLLADGDAVDPALYDQQWMYGAESSDAYAVDMDMDMDMDKGAFSELYEDGLNLMSWDSASEQKTSTDYWNRNMFQNGNVQE